MAIPLSLYVHFPWCVRKCPYCDFNSHALRDELPEQAYLAALMQDLEQQLVLEPGRPIETVFMGGGTPSLFSPAGIGALLDRLSMSGRLDNGAEITLEANPGTLDEARCEAYLEAGVNRISIGVQSFSDPLLEKIGRIHDARQAAMAVDASARAGFRHINADLIYGLPGQSLQAARKDLERAIASPVSHLSVYQLTIEPNTEFAHHPPPLPDAEQYWRMHEQAAEVLRAAGFEQYEVSAYTRDMRCQHNLNYWQFGDYLAIGAGAHGKLSEVGESGGLNIIRFSQQRHPRAYLKAVESGAFRAQHRQVPAAELDLEFLMNALRLRAGFSQACYAERTGGDVSRLLDRLTPFFERGWLLRAGQTILPSDEGFRFIDSILMEFL